MAQIVFVNPASVVVPTHGGYPTRTQADPSWVGEVLNLFRAQGIEDVRVSFPAGASAENLRDWYYRGWAPWEAANTIWRSYICSSALPFAPPETAPPVRVGLRSRIK
jgi:hypothetical protein